MTVPDIGSWHFSKRGTAYHEAGHAYVFYKLGIDVVRVTIKRDEMGRGGLCEPVEVGHSILHIIAAYAGFAAYAAFAAATRTPAQLADERTRLAEDDDSFASRKAGQFCADRLTEQTGQQHYRNGSSALREAERLTRRCEATACQMIVEGKVAIEELAVELLAQEAISGADVGRIIEAAMPGFQRDCDPGEVPAEIPTAELDLVFGGLKLLVDQSPLQV